MNRARTLRPTKHALKWLLTAVLAVVACLSPENAHAQLAASTGTDGGITLSDPRIRFVDPKTRWNNPIPTIALGIDVAAYWLPSKPVAVGFVLAPSFFVAGPQPSAGINFAVGPRVVWRSGRLHLAVDGSFVLSAYEDRCNSDQPGLADCPRTRETEPAALGLGAGLAPLIRVWSADSLDLLIGPAFRYQWARYDYTDGDGGFSLHNLQAVLAIRAFVDMTDTRSRRR